MKRWQTCDAVCCRPKGARMRLLEFVGRSSDNAATRILNGRGIEQGAKYVHRREKFTLEAFYEVRCWCLSLDGPKWNGRIVVDGILLRCDDHAINARWEARNVDLGSLLIAAAILLILYRVDLLRFLLVYSMQLLPVSFLVLRQTKRIRFKGTRLQRLSVGKCLDEETKIEKLKARLERRRVIGPIAMVNWVDWRYSEWLIQSWVYKSGRRGQCTSR